MEKKENGTTTRAASTADKKKHRTERNRNPHIFQRSNSGSFSENRSEQKVPTKTKQIAQTDFSWGLIVCFCGSKKGTRASEQKKNYIKKQTHFPLPASEFRRSGKWIFLMFGLARALCIARCVRPMYILVSRLFRLLGRSHKPAIGRLCACVNNTNTHKSFENAKWELNGHHKILCVYFWIWREIGSARSWIPVLATELLRNLTGSLGWLTACNIRARDGADCGKTMNAMQQIIRSVHSERQDFAETFLIRIVGHQGWRWVGIRRIAIMILYRIFFALV